MRTIYKYPLNYFSNTLISIQMPKDAEILHFDNQNEIPTLWAEVNTKADHENRHFVFFGTGDKMVGAKFLKYIASALFAEGKFVLHFYEITNLLEWEIALAEESKNKG
jgi:hypothetical protein